MTSDFLSLVLQAVGGAIADMADTDSLQDTGVDVMIAGLILQVISLSFFLIVGVDFFIRVLRRGAEKATDPSTLAKQRTRERTGFQLFLVSLLVATLAILARSIFRAAELWEGFEGRLWNSELDFMILDGAMIGLAVLLLSVWHPGVAFGTQWHEANWNLRGGKGKEEGRQEKLREGEESESNA